jgi:hypothetical protein
MKAVLMECVRVDPEISCIQNVNMHYFVRLRLVSLLYLQAMLFNLALPPPETCAVLHNLLRWINDKHRRAAVQGDPLAGFHYDIQTTKPPQRRAIVKHC